MLTSGHNHQDISQAERLPQREMLALIPRTVLGPELLRLVVRRTISTAMMS